MSKPSQRIAQHKANLAEMHGKKVEFGWFASNKYPDGTNVAQVAAWLENGYTVQLKNGARFVTPARPFLRYAVATAGKKINTVVGKVSNKVIDGQLTVEQALGQIGEFFVGEIVMSVKDGGWAPNSPITISGTEPDKNGKQFIKGKGFDSPLIHTGLMWQSAAYQVS